MLKIHRWFILLGLLFIVFIALSFEPQKKAADADFQQWIDDFTADLNTYGISEATIQSFRINATLLQEVIDSYNYRKANTSYTMAVDENLLLKAQVFYKENMDWLESNRTQYLISPEIIVAMFAVNNHFGEKLGDYPLVSILASLSYNVESSEEFKSELIAFLELVDKAHVRIDAFGNNDATFSYAGIRPTLYLDYGKDADNNSVIDLFTSRDDIVHTSFSMLKSLGLEQSTWSSEVLLHSAIDFDAKQGVRNISTMGTWKSLGIKSYDETIALPVDNRTGFLLVLEQAQRGLLLYNNFTVVLKTNNNLQKTIDILALSDKLVEYSKVLDYSRKNVQPNKKAVKSSKDSKSTKKDDQEIEERYKELSLVK